MPVKIAFPANAKTTAFVCSGRRRPKESQAVSKLNQGDASWSAIQSPTSIPTRPQMKVAQRNLRTIASS